MSWLENSTYETWRSFWQWIRNNCKMKGEDCTQSSWLCISNKIVTESRMTADIWTKHTLENLFIDHSGHGIGTWTIWSIMELVDRWQHTKMNCPFQWKECKATKLMTSREDIRCGWYSNLVIQDHPEGRRSRMDVKASQGNDHRWRQTDLCIEAVLSLDTNPHLTCSVLLVI